LNALVATVAGTWLVDLETEELRAAGAEEVVPPPALELALPLLVAAGYGLVDSLVLATREDVDVEEAATLLRRGCAPETAVRILI
jgi:hypothetical protein